MMLQHSMRMVIVCGLLCLWFAGCGIETMRRTQAVPEQAGTLDSRAPFLKVHMLNGEVYILHVWKVLPGENGVIGQGDLLNPNRETIRSDRFFISLDSVAIFETNRIEKSSALAPMTLITGISTALTVYCAMNPKACFGSCPTFYTEENGQSMLRAEGFSASIAPALEARDIDALYRTHPASRRFEITMKNEALETHVVRQVDLLVTPRPEGGRIIATPDGDFYEATHFVPPDQCLAPEGDCTPQLLSFDGCERFVPADATDLAAKEAIDLHFNVAQGGSLGLVIAARQTLMSTYVFYQSLSYLGHDTGAWLADIERGDQMARESFRNLALLLGGIEVHLQNPDGEWVRVGEIAEAGPLAPDICVLPLPPLPAGPVIVRLRLATGLYRIDYVALCALGNAVQPVRLQPALVRRHGKSDSAALSALCDSSQVLTTLPGDTYVLTYELPLDFDRYDLFLESRGYYLEWMRREWLAEENPRMAALLMRNPAEALRMMAPAFKQMEAEMEPIFWNSRYAH